MSGAKTRWARPPPSGCCSSVGLTRPMGEQPPTNSTAGGSRLSLRRRGSRYEPASAFGRPSTKRSKPCDFAPPRIAAPRVHAIRATPRAHADDYGRRGGSQPRSYSMPQGCLGATRLFASTGWAGPPASVSVSSRRTNRQIVAAVSVLREPERQPQPAPAETTGRRHDRHAASTPHARSRDYCGSLNEASDMG
jgi:hypothetical protein